MKRGVDPSEPLVPPLQILDPEPDIARRRRGSSASATRRLAQHQRRQVDEEDRQHQRDQRVEPAGDQVLGQARLAVDHCYEGMEDVGGDDRPDEGLQGVDGLDQDEPARSTAAIQTTTARARGESVTSMRLVGAGRIARVSPGCGYSRVRPEGSARFDPRSGDFADSSMNQPRVSVRRPNRRTSLALPGRVLTRARGRADPVGAREPAYTRRRRDGGAGAPAPPSLDREGVP